jgi:hypothetical protein
MAKAKDAPRPILRLRSGRLEAVTASDAELIGQYPQGQEFDLVPRSKRSAPHNSKYWAELGQIVAATGAWPSAEKMHDWVKIRLGYVSPVLGPKGQIVGLTANSTAFHAMKQDEFNRFYEQFAALVAADLGIDLATLERN